MTEVQVYVGDALARYGFGQGHPFSPDRLQAFWQELVRRGLDRRVRLVPPVQASDEELERFHLREYLEEVRSKSELGSGYLDYGDTPAFKGVYEAAAYVVGSTVDAVVQAVTGGVPRSFVPIAGLHHARRDAAAGFCVFNDAGVAIEVLRQQHGIERIAYVDIDAHHGDGVFYAFEEDPGVLVADIHEDGRFLYPGTGAAEETGKGPARGTKLNVSLLPGADDAAFLRVWPEVEQFVRSFNPEMIILQAGADSLAGDPIAQLQLSPSTHGFVAERLAKVADQCCAGRLVALGGGGYDRSNIALAWTAVVAAMLG